MISESNIILSETIKWVLSKLPVNFMFGQLCANMLSIEKTV